MQYLWYIKIFANFCSQCEWHELFVQMWQYDPFVLAINRFRIHSSLFHGFCSPKIVHATSLSIDHRYRASPVGDICVYYSDIPFRTIDSNAFAHTSILIRPLQWSSMWYCIIYILIFELQQFHVSCVIWRWCSFPNQFTHMYPYNDMKIDKLYLDVMMMVKSVHFTLIF